MQHKYLIPITELSDNYDSSSLMTEDRAAIEAWTQAVVNQWSASHSCRMHNQPMS